MTNREEEVVNVGKRSTLGLLKDKEEEVFKAWMEKQLASATLRLDRISKGDLEKQSREFLQAFLEVISTGNLENIEAPEYKPIIERLQEISNSRAALGFTPSETATYVFSLKYTLLQFLQEEFGDKPDIRNGEITAVSQLLDKLGLVTFETYTWGREEQILKQKETMTEMVTPVMILWKDILLLPVVGAVGSTRAQIIMETVLKRIRDTESKITLMDITGVPTVDSRVANHLVKITKATKLMGCVCIISGIAPAIAQTLVHLGIELRGVITTATLRDALLLAYEMRGYEVREKK
jgi:rsbT co-antagonist protein RsbR